MRDLYAFIAPLFGSKGVEPSFAAVKQKVETGLGRYGDWYDVTLRRLDDGYDDIWSLSGEKNRLLAVATIGRRSTDEPVRSVSIHPHGNRFREVGLVQFADDNSVRDVTGQCVSPETHDRFVSLAEELVSVLGEAVG